MRGIAIPIGVLCGAELLPESVVGRLARISSCLVVVVELTHALAVLAGVFLGVGDGLCLVHDGALGLCAGTLLCAALSQVGLAAVAEVAADAVELLPQRMLVVASRVAGRLPAIHQAIERIGRPHPVLDFSGELLCLLDDLLLGLNDLCLLGTQLGVMLVAAREERIAGGAELVPQLVVELFAGVARSAPLLHERALLIRGLAPIGGVGKLLGALDEGLLGNAGNLDL